MLEQVFHFGILLQQGCIGLVFLLLAAPSASIGSACEAALAVGRALLLVLQADTVAGRMAICSGARPSASPRECPCLWLWEESEWNGTRLSLHSTVFVPKLRSVELIEPLAHLLHFGADGCYVGRDRRKLRGHRRCVSEIRLDPLLVGQCSLIPLVSLRSECIQVMSRASMLRPFGRLRQVIIFTGRVSRRDERPRASRWARHPPSKSCSPLAVTADASARRFMARSA